MLGDLRVDFYYLCMFFCSSFYYFFGNVSGLEHRLSIFLCFGFWRGCILLKVGKLRFFFSVFVMLLIFVQLPLTLSSRAWDLPILGDSSLDVEVDVGSVHFRGELAEFYVLVSLNGERVDANVSADLYFDGVLISNLTSLVECVEVGFYRINYDISCDALVGVYALVVDTSYVVCLKVYDGVALGSFQLSRSLNNLNAWITDFQNDFAIVKTDVGLIKLSLKDLDAKLVNIENRVVSVHSDLGLIKIDIENIGLEITSVEGNIVEFNSFFGAFEGNITKIYEGIMNITTILGPLEANMSVLNATISGIDNKLVSIQTSIGEIQVDLSSIDAKLVRLEGNLAFIRTSFGVFSTRLENIELKILEIEGNTTSISTVLGDLQGSIISIQGDLALIVTDLGEIEVDVSSVGDTQGEGVFWLGVLIVAANAVAGVSWLGFMLKKR